MGSPAPSAAPGVVGTGIIRRPGSGKAEVRRLGDEQQRTNKLHRSGPVNASNRVPNITQRALKHIILVSPCYRSASLPSRVAAAFSTPAVAELLLSACSEDGELYTDWLRAAILIS